METKKIWGTVVVYLNLIFMALIAAFVFFIMLDIAKIQMKTSVLATNSKLLFSIVFGICLQDRKRCLNFYFFSQNAWGVHFLHILEFLF